LINIKISFIINHKGIGKNIKVKFVINKDILRGIGDKEMDRKEFLKYSGLALLSLFGFKTVATLLLKSDNKTVSILDSQNNTRGFGSGKYGA